MNKQTHQLVFNAARGCIMVVSEAAKRQGKRPGCVAGQRVARSVALVWALTGLGAALVQAQIIADPTAPGNQRPTVLDTPNGVPLVNIQTPSAAGVSRNTYQQFDVGAPGVVLNNSPATTQTQLGGWVHGNPWLITGEARVILNEVNSHNPSYLNGFIEVAGRRADVIIANPAGIQVNGAGFINASRATLTTGTPVMNGGNLEGYRVQRGTIRIDGKGLDASQTDYTGVLSRAIEVNAKIHAQQLDMVTGDNHVQAATGEAQNRSADTTPNQPPSFAIDVGELGGMYAGHIRLVGTEAGVGVRHHGNMAASVGDVQLDTNGWLTSAGRIEASKGNVNIQTTDAQGHSGVLLAAGNLTLNSGTSAQRQALTLSGQSRAGLEATIRASDMTNKGQLDAQRLDLSVENLSNSGQIWQSGTQDLQLQTATFNNAAGGSMGAVTQVTTTPAPIPTPEPTPTPNPENTSGPTTSSTSAETSAPVQLAIGQIVVSGTLDNQDKGTLAAAGRLQVSTTQAFSNAGHTRVQTLKAQGDRFETTAGTVETQSLDIDVQTIALTGATVIAQQAKLNSTSHTQAQDATFHSQSALQVSSGQFRNSGTLTSANDLTINADSIDSSGTLAAGLNADGTLKAFAADGASLSVSTTGDLTAHGSNLAAGALRLSGEALNLSSSQTSAYSADITARADLIIDNTKLITSGNTTIDAQSLSNRVGSVYAGGLINIKVDQALINTGTLAAADDATLRASSVDSSGTLAAGLNADGTLKVFAVEGAALTVTATDQLTATGSNLAAGYMSLSGGSLGINSSQTNAYSIDMASDGALSSKGSTIMAQDNLTLITTGELNNEQGKLTSAHGAVAVTASAINNTQGLIQSNAAIHLTANTINNSQTSSNNQGVLGQDLHLGVAVLNNHQGQVLADRDLTITAIDSIVNTQGKLNAQRRLTLQDGPLGIPTAAALRQLAITNTGGQIVAHNTAAPADSSVDVRAKTLGLDGTLSSGGDMGLDLSGSLHTQTGQAVRAGRNLAVQLHGAVAGANNFVNAGQWQAGQDLDIRADHIDNQASGEISSQSTTNLNTTQHVSGSVTNRGLLDGTDTHLQSHTLANMGTGRIYGDRVVVAVHSLVNREETVGGVTNAATIAARERLDIGAQHITNREGSVIFSAGDISIGGELDATQRAVTNGSASAKALNNNSATIESLGDLAMATDVLRNTNDHLAWTVITNGATHHREDFSSTVYRTYSQTTQSAIVTKSAPGKLLAAGNMSLRIHGQGFNQDSQIISGGVISGDVGLLNNHSTKVNTTTVRRGATNDWGTVGKDCDFFDSKCDPEYGWRTNPYNETFTHQVTLPTMRFQQHTTTSGSSIHVQRKAATGSAASASVADGPVISAVLNGQSAATTSALAFGSAGTTAKGGNAVQEATAGLSQQASPAWVLPSSNLFMLHPEPTARFLVETDPRFVNYRDWLSSDYLLTATGFKPEDTQKRLGDGFYEQKLIREQVAALTGYRFLGDYRSDEAQYTALMNAGSTFARAHQLRPGIALSAAQVAALTSDIVWLETQSVQLPDGSTTQALVPRVYLSPKAGDLAANGQLFGGADSTGSLISARDIELALSGDLSNSGTIAGRRLLDISAKNIENTGLLQGEEGKLKAEQDISVVGGQVVGRTGLEVQAGGDLTIESTTTQGQGSAGRGVFASSQVDRVAGLYVSAAAGKLLASAGGDMNLVAAQVSNQGQGVTQLQAGDKLNLGTLQTGMSSDVTHDAQNYARVQMSQEVGTQISGGGAVNLVAQNDLSARAVMVNAQGALSLQSTGGNVNIEAGQSTEGIQTGSHLQAGGWVASKAVTQTSNTQSTTAQASELGGQSVSIRAGQDLSVKGSNVLADEDVVLAAQRDLTIEAAQNTSTSSSFNETKKSGLMSGGGLSVTIGKQSQSLDQGQQQTTAAASTIGSVGGNVSITAGKTYTQSGSDVLSPAGDIDISAQTVNITEARETGSQSTEQQFKQSGLTVGLGGGIIDTAQASIQGLEGVVGGGSKRNQTLNALIAYGKSFDLYGQGKAVQAAAGENGLSGAAAASGIKVSVSVGSSSSQSNSLTQINTGAGSTVKAGGSVNIKATGQSVGEGDLTVQGSRVSAAKDVTLSATQDVNILASADTESNRSRNSSSSTSVGVSFGVGAGSAGLSLDIAASRGKGQANSDSTTHNNSLIEAGQTANITSGADTNVVGGNVKAQQVAANVGGNLNVESLQDKATSKADQKTTGIAVSIPIVGTGGSASMSQTQQKSRSNYASVNEQSGITAGDGGFQLNVGGNTDLKGAIIAGSSDASKNTLTTQTLTTSDISNSMSASASSSGTSVGTNMMDGQYAMGKAVAGNLLNNGKASQGDESTTTSAISAAQVTVGSKTTDTSKEQLKDSNGKAVSTDTSNTNRTLAKADVAELQKSAQDEQASNMLAFNAATTVSDPINRAMTADKKIVLQTCQADGQCVQKRVNAEDVKIGSDGKVYVFNNGIMNSEAQALDNAAKQSGPQANTEGVYVIINPHTGNVISEIIYAGFDKLNEMAGAVLPISNASEANIDLRNATQSQGGQVVEVNHSRGSLTSSNATAEQINQGTRNAPIESVTFNGAAANAQRMADRVDTVTGGTGTVLHSTHKDDKIGTVIGGNAPTGGRDASVGAAHTNYGPGVSEDKKEMVWGNSVGSVPVVVQPTSSQGGEK